MVDGTRAPILKGTPIYGPKLFKSQRDGRAWHVRTVESLSDHPIHDARDFGQLHPACVFSQLTWWGQLRILGAIEGDDIFLEHFAPLVKEQRAERFGDKATYDTTCDPAGTTGNAHGTILNGIKILESHDIHPITSFNLNRIEGISYAIETIGGFMSREVVQPISTWCGCEYCQYHQPGSREGDRLRHELVVRDGKILHGVRVPALVVDGRRHLKLSNTDSVEWPVLINGFTSGYVHDKRAPQGESNLKRPLKDGEHDHTQRCLEYTVQQFWKTRPAGEQLEADIIRFHEARASAEERAERRARGKDTVETTHQRMMRDLRVCQPGGRELRPRAWVGRFLLGGPLKTGRRGGC
jgi:hypothetical protein